ncbi:MAG: AI-2E family transporter [Gammaproteobacteria bacterium]|nr:AI-2E family transporter [Gammaproteobacteria bacterium]
MADEITAAGESSAGAASPTERASLPADVKVPIYGLFILAVFYTLYLTRDIALPITLALLVSLLLAPAVEALARRKLPRALGAMLLLGSLVGGLAGIAYLVSDPLLEWLEEAPEGLTELLVTHCGLHDGYERMTRSAREVEETVEQFLEEGDEAPTTVVLESESWRGQFLVTAQRSAAVLLAGDRMVVQFMDQLRSESSRRAATGVIKDAQREIGRYLAFITVSNSLVGVVTGLLAWLMGLPSPLVWGG